MSKSIAKNFLFNTVYSLVKVLYPIVTLTYVSRTLLAEGVGKFSFCLSIVCVFLSIAQMGIPKYGIREIARNQNDKEKYSQTFWEIFVINAISTTIIIILYFVCIFKISYLQNYLAILIILSMLLFFNYFSVDWFYAGIEDFQYITIRSIIIKIIALIFVFIYIKSPEDVLIYSFIYSLTMGGNNVINVLNLKGKILKPTYKLKIKNHIKPVMVLLAMNIAVDLYTQLDTTMLGVLCSDEAVAYYVNPMKFVRVLVTIIISIGTVLFPRLSMLYHTGKKNKVKDYIDRVWNFTIYISTAFMVGIIITAPELVVIFLGESFVNSIQTLRLLAVLIPILSIGNILTFELITYEKEKKILIAVSAGAITNMVLNYCLIPYFEQDGATIASVIAESIVVIINLYFVNKEFRHPIINNECLKILINGLIMGGICFFVGDKMFVAATDIVQLVIKVVVGVISYVVFSLIVLKDKTGKWLLQYLLSKVIKDRKWF